MPHARIVVVTLGGLVLVVSLVPPLQAAAGATGAWLVSMHLAVFAAVLPPLAKAVGQPQASTPASARA